MIENAYDRCVEALDAVTKSFREIRDGIREAPTRYEADFAAYKLMQLVWLHVNSVSHIAAIRYTGSHLASAWVLIRSAFETAVTSLWLTIDDDWKEREARWLGWAAGEEKHWRNLSTEFKSLNPEYSQKAEEFANRLQERREAITRLLPKDSRESRPKMPRMLREAGVAANYYIPYRIACQVIHGGAGADEWAVRQEDNRIYFAGVVRPGAWKEAFRMASWSITQPGVTMLKRAGVSQSVCTRIVDCHDKLLEMTQQLDD